MVSLRINEQIIFKFHSEEGGNVSVQSTTSDKSSLSKGKIIMKNKDLRYFG